MVDHICLIVVILNDGQKRNLHKWDKLTKNEPDINHSYIGSWWQLFHHTKGYYQITGKYKHGCKCLKIFNKPNKQGGDDQHGCQVDCKGSFKKEWFEEGCGVGDSKQEESW